MNKKRLLILAKAIESGSVAGLGFNMETYVNHRTQFLDDTSGRGCGTVACIAGWAAHLAMGSEKPLSRYEAGDVRILARKWLDLTFNEADGLFIPPLALMECLEIKPAQAVAVLRQFVETGEICWD